MGFLSRNFGTFFLLALAGGLALGAVLAQRGIEVDLGTVGGVKLALTTAEGTKTPPVAVAGSVASPTPAATATRVPQPANPGVPATPSQGLGRATTGTIQKVEDTMFTVAAQDGTTTKVAVTGSTVLQKSAAVTVADIKVGDTVTVVGQTAGDGSIVAQQVTVGVTGTGQPQGSNGGRTGTVQKIEGNTLTVGANGGQASKVTVSADTRLRRTAPGAVTDLTPGEQVTVIGQAGTDGTVVALMVQIGVVR